MPAKQFKNLCVTINNPKDDDFAELVAISNYAVGQLEKGANGTPHLQVYVILKKKSTMNKLKAFNPRAHWEPRRGSHKQARDYCMKEDTRVSGPWEMGVPPAQGKRTDLDLVKEAIDDGATLPDIADDYFTQFVKYHKGLQLYFTMKQDGSPRDFKTRVVYIYGPTGVGKTYWARHQFPTEETFIMPPQKEVKWWNGYNPMKHRCVVFDEFGGQIRLLELLRLLDETACQVEIKGGFLNFRPEVVIITSNKAPLEVYCNKTVDELQPFTRRIDELVYNPRRGIYSLQKLSGLFPPMIAPPLPPVDVLREWPLLYQGDRFPGYCSMLEEYDDPQDVISFCSPTGVHGISPINKCRRVDYGCVDSSPVFCSQDGFPQFDPSCADFPVPCPVPIPGRNLEFEDILRTDEVLQFSDEEEEEEDFLL